MGVDPGESQLPLHVGSHKQKGVPEFRKAQWPVGTVQWVLV